MTSNKKLWHVPPVVVNRKKEVFGSVLLDEYSIPDEIVLQFFSANLDAGTTEKAQFPQRPLGQEWHVEYPILAYKTFKPDNKEICIVNIAADVPCKMIDLGDFEFISFIKHTQMVNKKLFRKQREDKIIFTILVQHNGNLRLISYNVNSALNNIS